MTTNTDLQTNKLLGFDAAGEPLFDLVMPSQGAGDASRTAGNGKADGNSRAVGIGKAEGKGKLPGSTKHAGVTR